MINIELLQIPNQKFSIDIENNTFEITLNTTSVTVATIVINDITIISGVACLPNTEIIPYQYLANGNFFFICEDENYPYYNKFGISQSLVYLTNDEIEALNG